MKKETWVLVANGSLAKIFKMEKNSILTEVTEIAHPESRQQEQDLVSSRPGRTFGSMGGGTIRHAYERPHTQKNTELHIFAKSLADFLDAARNKGDFARLYIAANPQFLGILRQSLSSNTHQLIAGEVDKDMTHLSSAEILAHIHK